MASRFEQSFSSSQINFDSEKIQNFYQKQTSIFDSTVHSQSKHNSEGNFLIFNVESDNDKNDKNVPSTKPLSHSRSEGEILNKSGSSKSLDSSAVGFSDSKTSLTSDINSFNDNNKKKGEVDDLTTGEGKEIKNAGHRLYVLGMAREKLKREKIAAIKEKRLINELLSINPIPNITPLARQWPSSFLPDSEELTDKDEGENLALVNAGGNRRPQKCKALQIADDYVSWKKERERRLVELSERLKDREVVGLLPAPLINQKSAEITEINNYQGPVRGWYDHFARYYAKKCAAEATSLTSSGPSSQGLNRSSMLYIDGQPSSGSDPLLFTPNINTYYFLKKKREKNKAKENRVRAGGAEAEDVVEEVEEVEEEEEEEEADVGARLYHEYFKREQKKRQLESKVLNEQLRDSKTNQPFFSPIQNEGYPIKGAVVGETPEEAGARLHALHEKKLKKLKESISSDSLPPECSFSPCIDPNSVELAEKKIAKGQKKPLYYVKKQSGAENTSENSLFSLSSSLNVSKSENNATSESGGGKNRENSLSIDKSGNDKGTPMGCGGKDIGKRSTDSLNNSKGSSSSAGQVFSKSRQGGKGFPRTASNDNNASDNVNKSISGSFSMTEFLRRAERSNIVKQNRLNKIREERLEYEFKECSFKPDVNRRSIEIFNQNHQYGIPIEDAITYAAAFPYSNISTNNSNIVNSPAPFTVASIPPSGTTDFASGNTYNNNAIKTDNNYTNNFFSSTPGGQSYNQYQQYFTPKDTVGSIKNNNISNNTDVNNIIANQNYYSNNIANEQEENDGIDTSIQEFQMKMLAVMNEWKKLETF